MKKTKIICTIGPSSEDKETLRRLLMGGMNVARINCSHGTHEEHRKKIENFREVRDELGISGAVLLDTKGPEIRVKNFKNVVELLEDEQEFLLTPKEIEGDHNRVSVTYKRLAQEVVPGNIILIDDGKISMQVKSIVGEDVLCQVIHGGKVSNHKGINIPDVRLSMDYISPADVEDLLFGIDMEVDYVAASFVRNKQDIEALRDLLGSNGGENIRIIAKIESNEGLENFEDILKVSNGIMIARGDMGVEIPFERLPGIQKEIITRGLQAGKTTITATQMLESMIEKPSPTRAEITDVANAVFDGTGAVMLSGETAAGKFPVEALEAMNKIILQAEKDVLKEERKVPLLHDMNYLDVTNAVGHSACTLAKDIKAAAIMAITKTGYTARRMSKFRPLTPIVALTPYTKTYHQMALEWGVTPLKVSYKDSLEALMTHCINEAKSSGILKFGEKVVISAGLPLDIPGNTNIIRVEKVL